MKLFWIQFARDYDYFIMIKLIILISVQVQFSQFFFSLKYKLQH